MLIIQTRRYFSEVAEIQQDDLFATGYFLVLKLDHQVGKPPGDLDNLPESPVATTHSPPTPPGGS
jgi:hypothetical protein